MIYVLELYRGRDDRLGCHEMDALLTEVWECGVTVFSHLVPLHDYLSFGKVCVHNLLLERGAE